MLFKKLPQLKGKINLDIGCGEKKQPGYIGIDVRDCGQEIIWDVRNGIPLPDNSVDSVISIHFIEHLTNDEALKLFDDVYRILKPDGTMFNVVPHADDPTAYYFDHETFWNESRITALGRVEGFKFKITKNHKTARMIQIDGFLREFYELIFELKK